MNNNLELLNFKLPSAMKKQFHETCQSRNQQMTSILNQFIADFINANQPQPDEATLPLDFFSDADADEPRL